MSRESPYSNLSASGNNESRAAGMPSDRLMPNPSDSLSDPIHLEAAGSMNSAQGIEALKQQHALKIAGGDKTISQMFGEPVFTGNLEGSTLNPSAQSSAAQKVENSAAPVVNQYARTHVGQHLEKHPAQHPAQHAAEHIVEHAGAHLEKHPAQHPAQHTVEHAGQHPEQQVAQHVEQHQAQHPGQHVTQHAGQHPEQQVAQHVEQHQAQHPGQHVTQHAGQHREQHPAQHAGQHPEQQVAQHVEQHSAQHSGQQVAQHVEQHSAQHSGQQVAQHVEQHPAQHAGQHPEQQVAQHVEQHSAQHSGQQVAQHVEQHSAQHSGQYTVEHAGQHREQHPAQHVEQHPTQHAGVESKNLSLSARHENVPNSEKPKHEATVHSTHVESRHIADSHAKKHESKSETVGKLHKNVAEVSKNKGTNTKYDPKHEPKQKSEQGTKHEEKSKSGEHDQAKPESKKTIAKAPAEQEVIDKGKKVSTGRNNQVRNTEKSNEDDSKEGSVDGQKIKRNLEASSKGKKSTIQAANAVNEKTDIPENTKTNDKPVVAIKSDEHGNSISELKSDSAVPNKNQNELSAKSSGKIETVVELTHKDNSKVVDTTDNKIVLKSETGKVSEIAGADKEKPSKSDSSKDDNANLANLNKQQNQEEEEDKADAYQAYLDFHNKMDRSSTHTQQVSQENDHKHIDLQHNQHQLARHSVDGHGGGHTHSIKHVIHSPVHHVKHVRETLNDTKLTDSSQKHDNNSQSGTDPAALILSLNGGHNNSNTGQAHHNVVGTSSHSNSAQNNDPAILPNGQLIGSLPNAQQNDPSHNNNGQTNNTNGQDPNTKDPNAKDPNVNNTDPSKNANNSGQNNTNSHNPGETQLGKGSVGLPVYNEANSGVYDERPVKYLADLLSELENGIGLGIWGGYSDNASSIAQSPYNPYIPDTLAGSGSININGNGGQNIFGAPIASVEQNGLIGSVPNIVYNGNAFIPSENVPTTVADTTATVSDGAFNPALAQSTSLPLHEIIAQGSTANYDTYSSPNSTGSTGSNNYSPLHTGANPNVDQQPNLPQSNAANNIVDNGSSTLQAQYDNAIANPNFNPVMNGPIDPNFVPNAYPNNTNAPIDPNLVANNYPDNANGPVDILLADNPSQYTPDYGNAPGLTPADSGKSDHLSDTNDNLQTKDHHINSERDFETETLKNHDESKLSEHHESNNNDSEIPRHLDQIFSTWLDPYSNNGSSAQFTGKLPAGRVSFQNNLLGQLVTLLGDLQGKKAKNKNVLTYVVQQNDTFESIALKALHDPGLAMLVYLTNKTRWNARLIEEWRGIKLIPGTILFLPSDEEVKNFKASAPNSVNKNGNQQTIQWHFDQEYLKGIDDRRRNIERLLGSFGNSEPESNYHPETGRQIITIRLGDTLRSIALKHSALKDVSLWKLLAKCNNLSTEVNDKGMPLAFLTRGMTLQIPGQEEILFYRLSQAAIVRAQSPRKAIAEEVLQINSK